MPPPTAQAHERTIWEGYPSWLDHTILFLFMGGAALRTLLALRTAQWTVAMLYGGAMGIFFAIAAAFHYGSYYQVTSLHVRILNGVSKRCTRDIPIAYIRAVNVRPELLSRWLGVGSLVLSCAEAAGDTVVLKGVPDPDRVKVQLDALLGRHGVRTADAASPR